MSEREACRALETNRGSYRRPKKMAGDEAELTGDVIRLATQYGRYGYKKVTALLKVEGWPVNHKRVERIWRQEGLRVPERHKKRGRLYLNDGSCIRLRPCWPNHVWSYDFVFARLMDGTKIRFLTVIDEYTRECLALHVDYRLKSDDVMEVLTGLFIQRGIPNHIRSDNGSEFTAPAIRLWLEQRIGVKPLYISPGSPWENGYNESFNGKFRKEFLDLEVFYTLKEAQVLTGQWRYLYNHIRPHISLGYKPPAPLACPLPDTLRPAAVRGARSSATLQPALPAHYNAGKVTITGGLLNGG